MILETCDLRECARDVVLAGRRLRRGSELANHPVPDRLLNSSIIVDPFMRGAARLGGGLIDSGEGC